MLVLMEGLVMCFVLLLICVVLIRNGAVDGVIFYEDDVKKRVVELGYTTEKQSNETMLSLPLRCLFPFLLWFRIWFTALTVRRASGAVFAR